MDLALEPQRAELEAFFDNSPVGFSRLDGDLRYVRVNRALAEINGHPAHAHIGRRQDEIVPDVDGVIRRVQQRVLDRGEPSLGHTVRAETPAHPGVVRQFEVDYFPLDDGCGGRMVGCVVHETGRSEGLVRAIESESRRTRDVADNLNFFLANLDGEGTLLNVNAPALRVTGVKRKDVAGRKFWDCPWWTHDEGMQAHVRRITEAALAGEFQRSDCIARIPDDGRMEIDVQLAPLRAQDGSVIEIVASGVDVSAQRKAERQREIHFAELQHRVKNIFANVQSLSRLIASQSADLPGFLESFDHRMRALSRANDTLLRTEWSDIYLRDLLVNELAACMELGAERFEIEGPPTLVSARQAPMLALGMHELVTNAAKYGALARAGGRIAIRFAPDADGFLSEFRWCERGGAPVSEAQDQRTGFGSMLLERIVPGTLGLVAEIDLEAEGLCYRLAPPG